jgi:hypothetical protein
MNRGCFQAPAISWASVTVLTATVLAHAGCASRPAAGGDEIRYDDIEGPFQLSLSSMTSLPDGVVLLGGSYRTPADPVHSCLLISRDAGKTWAEAPHRFLENTIGRLVSVGREAVWALALFNKEGAASPERLLVSRDAARTWEIVPWTWGPGGPLEEVVDFRFMDASHGLAWVRNSSGFGRGRMLQTSDAGRSWHPIWDTEESSPEDWPLQYPREDVPLHASVLTPQPGYETPAQGLLRVIEGDGLEDPFVIERIVYWQGRAPRDAVWEKWSEIPREYVVEKGSLKPKGS